MYNLRETAEVWKNARVAACESPSVTTVRALGDAEAALVAVLTQPGMAHNEMTDAIDWKARAEAAESRLAMARAEVEMLRGVGCNEDGDGPCGACIKCARARVEAAERERDEWRAGKYKSDEDYEHANAARATAVQERDAARAQVMQGERTRVTYQEERDQARSELAALVAAVGAVRTRPSNRPEDATWTEDGAFFLTPADHADRALRTTLASLSDAARARDEAIRAKAIDEATGLDTNTRVRFYEHDFYPLSNFSSFSVSIYGRRFPTSEHAYHFAKFPGMPIADDIADATSAHVAFQLAQNYRSARRYDWDDVKVDVMRKILRAKVAQHEYVRRKLLATGDRELVEDSWRDDFWGWGPNRNGQNMLGKLWIEIRAELRADKDGTR